jgi:hypothetical protein
MPLLRLPEFLVNAYLLAYQAFQRTISVLPEVSAMSEVEQAQASAIPQVASKKDRSPSFPFITLTKAIERTRALYDAAKRHEVRLPDAAKAMGYAPKSSGAIQTLAALLAYGLAEDNGTGEARKFRVSDLGFKVLEDQRPGARESALAAAAVSPKLIAEYAEHWADGRPDDPICESELRFERGFTAEGATAFLRVFDDAMSYAKVGGSDKNAETAGQKGDGVKPPAPELSVGDLVQVEAGGQLVFERTRVRAIQGQWVFVEASKAGAKMSDVTVLEKAPAGADQTPPVLEFAPKADAVEPGEEMDRFTVDEGVVKVIFPSGMTPDSVEELEQFFQLFIKKAKRRAGADKAAD